jgi:KipI family sensor histidine kinase inhibitor
VDSGKADMSFADMGDGALLVSLPRGSRAETAARAAALGASLSSTPIPGLIETIPGLTSLLVVYDPAALPRQQLVSHARAADHTHHAPVRKRWELPVMYGGDAGPDLDTAATELGLTVDQFIGGHSGQDYQVYMLGFLPGFPYMGDLPGHLRLPRRPTPHLRVPAGSVAIAAEMTGIYPLESPGGWHVIGRCPIPMWDLRRNAAPLLAPGDRVQFRPVSAAEFGHYARAPHLIEPAVP